MHIPMSSPDLTAAEIAAVTRVSQTPFLSIGVEKSGYKPGDFPVTERLGETSLALPFSSVMTEDQVDYVCSHLIEIVRSQFLT